MTMTFSLIQTSNVTTSLGAASPTITTDGATPLKARTVEARWAKASPLVVVIVHPACLLDEGLHDAGVRSGVSSRCLLARARPS